MNPIHAFRRLAGWQRQALVMAGLLVLAAVILHLTGHDPSGAVLFGAAAGVTNFDQIKSDFKEVYASGITEYMPDHVVLQKLTPWTKKAIGPGKEYVEPVRVKRPNGFTFANSGAGAYNKNTARAGKLEDARIKANNVHLVEVLDKESVHRAHEAGKEAFKSATSLVVDAMYEACRNLTEVNILYGQTELARTASAANVNSKTVLTITPQEWGPGIWMGAEDMPIEIYDSTGATLKASATIDSVDVEGKKLNLDKDILALIAGGGGDYVWRAGTRTAAGTNEAAGLMKILTNQSVIFNIDASKYTLWQASQLDVGAVTMTFFKWLQLSGKCMIKGLRGGALGLCSVDSYNTMANDEAAFRRYLGREFKGKIEIGPDALVFVGASGSMALKPHAMLKKGYGMLLNLDVMNSDTPGGDYKRIGAVGEWTWEENNGSVLNWLADVAGYQIELYSNSALLVDPPGRSGLAKNITDGL